MKPSDVDPVSAWVSGIQSGLGRILVAWGTMSVGLALPLTPHLDMGAAWAAVFWPVTVLLGCGYWGRLPGGLALAAVLIPLGLFLCAWGYITDHSPRISLWGLLTLSLLLTGPAALDSSAFGWILGGWVAWTGLVLGVPVWWARRQDREP